MEKFEFIYNQPKMAMLFDQLIKSVLPFIVFVRMVSYLWFKVYFGIFKRFEWKTNDGKYWAVVTGSTDGIGFEFARQLAAKNYNILMISRNAQKLEEKRRTILNEHSSIQIKTLAVDFKHTDIYDEIKKFLNVHLEDIFILVNNVGTSMGINNYADEDANGHKELVNINVISTLGMTDLILPTMISKKHGLIINVSSLASKIELPCLATYGATKVSNFSTYKLIQLIHDKIYRHLLHIFLELCTMNVNLITY